MSDIHLGTVTIPPELAASAGGWWHAAAPEARTHAFLAGVCVIRDGLHGSFHRQQQGTEAAALLREARALAAEDAKANFDARLETQVARAELAASRQMAALQQQAGRLEERCVLRERELQALRDMLTEANGARAERDAALAQLAAFKGTNQGKGIAGEQAVAEALRRLYHDHEVVVKGGVEAHCQDVHLVLPSGGLLAFEVKNKRVIGKPDIDKFYRDMDDLCTHSRCQGAMFISLGTPNIPHKGSFCVELRGGRPAMFVGFDDPETVDAAALRGHVAVLMSLCTLAEASADEGAQAMERLLARLAPQVERVRLLKRTVATIFESATRTMNSASALQREVETLFTEMDSVVQAGEAHVAPPMCCDVCGRTFKTAGALKNHKRKCPVGGQSPPSVPAV